jgi:hypothetical protein
MTDELAAVAERIEWSEELFSTSLAEAVSAQQFSRSQELLRTFDRHARQRLSPYPQPDTKRDMDKLRSKRLFTLMRQYAEAALQSGATYHRLRRQYGQALIELGAFDQARETLESVVRDRDQNPFEGNEARGLIGRSLKQQYVDAPTAPGAEACLRRAIEAYLTPYLEDTGHKNDDLLWHGINAVSCTLRAARDHLPWANVADARDIANVILARLARKSELEVWDLATRVEALLAIKEVPQASVALDRYLGDPRIDTFEVWSTHRQFDQVLQLREHEDPLARSMLDRLRHATEEHRAGPSFRRFDDGSEKVSVLLRVVDPDWDPPRRPDLVVHARMGTILAVECTREALSALVRDPMIVSIDDSRKVPGSAECHISLPFIKVAPTYAGAGGPYAESGDHALVAVIDDGIDVLHQTFLHPTNKASSRIIGIWDQTDPTGPPPDGFSFGTYHDSDMIDGYLRDKKVPLRLGRDPMGHGTHVASIAAGQGAGTFTGGVAPAASLLIVIADRSETIGYSAAHLAALKFIDGEATRRNMPVVVNVSHGMNAGAHDGRSALEAGFERFSDSGRTPGRVVVKSAGNERGKHGHAAMNAMHEGEVNIGIERPADATSNTELIELWWSSANDLQFRLCDPLGTWSDWVRDSNPLLVEMLDDTPVEMRFRKRHGDNGRAHLAITLGKRGAVPASGKWKLQMYGQKVIDKGTVHAWIERSDSPSPMVFLDAASDDMTLSIPGTAYSVITVGAVHPSRGAPVGDSSSFGPTIDDRHKPEVSAPGVGITAANGGTTSGVAKRDGTSMAAPHVTGAIALVLSRAVRQGSSMPNANQLTTALAQSTTNYNGRWDPGKGFGVVDVEKFLAAEF